jgi:hypothetical protein
LSWIRITEPEQAAEMLPAWLSTRMIGLRGKFGLLITTGDVLRVSSVIALNQSSDGTVLLDVLLDHAGVPEGVDTAWQPKHYLGAPVPGATMATVNLAHVIGAVEFVAAPMVEGAEDEALWGAAELPSEERVDSATVETTRIGLEESEAGVASAATKLARADTASPASAAAAEQQASDGAGRRGVSR